MVTGLLGPRLQGPEHVLLLFPSALCPLPCDSPACAPTHQGLPSCLPQGWTPWGQVGSSASISTASTLCLPTVPPHRKGWSSLLTGLLPLLLSPPISSSHSHWHEFVSMKLRPCRPLTKALPWPPRGCARIRLPTARMLLTLRSQCLCLVPEHFHHLPRRPHTY